MSVDRENDYPGEKFNREEVLAQCPFLKSYLNMGISGMEKFEEEADKIDKELTSFLGEKWEQNTLLPLVLFVQSAKLFEKRRPLQEYVGGVKMFLFAGYELNSTPKADFFLLEIATALNQEVPLNREYLSSSQKIEFSYNLMRGLMKVGEFLHNIKDSNNRGDNPFETFIEGLDL